MAGTIRGDHHMWEGSRDDDGHRTYWIAHTVEALSGDGPEEVMATSGLPAIGATWSFKNDSDSWAFCYPFMEVKPLHGKRETGIFWEVKQKFSTRPLDRCMTTAVEDPLLEPDRISGSFTKFTQEITEDRHGDAIKSSSHELFRGPQVEFDHNRPSVRIEQNNSTLGLDTFSEMVDTVNDATLWGLAARKIKLSNVSWQRKQYTVCTYYYTRIFDFDVDFNGWDREILDEGTRVLHGKWASTSATGTGTGSDDTNAWSITDFPDGTTPDKDNPQHFIEYQDRHGNIGGRVLLDGNGKPLSEGVHPSKISVEFYPESDFTTLGIPASL